MEPDCRLGYTYAQIKALTSYREEEFWHWMSHQTMAVCEGNMCDGVAHGAPIVYRWDLERFLANLPITD